MRICLPPAIARRRRQRARSPHSASSPPRSTAPASRSARKSLARTSFWLLYAEEDRYRLLARNMTDVITRHGKNGAVLFVSPAAEPLFGAARERTHRPRPVRPRACRRPAGLSHRARRCGRARRAALGRIPHPPRQGEGAANSSGSRCAASRSTRAGEKRRSARWSRCCATSASARRMNRRWRSRAPSRSAPMRRRAASSRP